MICKAKIQDLNEILNIINSSKQYLKDNKVPQWQGPYPNIDTITSQINNQIGYIYKEDNEILGYFAVKEYEPNYDYIENGKWLDDSSYVAIHTLAVKYKSKGLGDKVIKLLNSRYKHIRIDTHELNTPMNSCLLKNGYKYCGIIYVEDKTPRKAYEYIGGAYGIK